MRYCKASATKTPVAVKPIADEAIWFAALFPLEWEPLLAVWFVPLTPEEGFATFPVHTKPLPLTTPLVWRSGKGHWNVDEEVWTLTPPRISLMSGREALSKDPVQSMDPPIVVTWLKPPMVVSSVLLAMRNVPPMVVSLGNDVFVNELQLTNERELPIEVKFGAEIEVIEESKNPKLLVTLARALKLIDWMFRKEAFCTVRSSGRLTVSWGELAATVRAPLISLSEGCEIELRKRLLSTIRTLQRARYYQCQNRWW